MRTVIFGGKAVDGGKIKESTIIAEDGIITGVLPGGAVETAGDDRLIDASGCYVCSGFIDLHTHGIGGYDFMDNEPHKIGKALQSYAKHGVTGVYPTTLASGMDDLAAVLDGFAETEFKNTGGAEILGIHLEGPYFSPAQCGAQPKEYLKNPCREEYKMIAEKYPFVKRWDLAPELDGALEMAGYLSENGIIASAAHTDATAGQILEAAENGFTAAAHLFSGMSGVHRVNGYRVGGAVEGCMLCDRIKTEVIGDGIHVPKELMLLAYKVKGNDKMCLVSDSSRGADLQESAEFMLGSKTTGVKAVIDGGVAWLPDRSAFAGSIAVYDRMVRNVIDMGIPIEDAVRMSSQNPAEIMHLKNKGRLKKGYDADIVLFDSDVNVRYTIVGGEIVYKRI